MRGKLIGRFLLFSILWLILLLPLWYLASPWLSRPPIWLAGTFMEKTFSWVGGWHQEGVRGFLDTLVQVRYQTPQGDVLRTLRPNASYPLFGYGMVLLWAMLLAARTPRWWLKGLIGSVILIPIQTWGICFKWMRDVVIMSGPYGIAYLEYSPVVMNAIIYGYQFGTLMLPPMAPILLWLMFNKSFVAALWLEAALEDTPEHRAHLPTQSGR